MPSPDYAPQIREQALRLCAEGATRNEVAEALGCHRETVTRWARKAGIAVRTARAPTQGGPVWTDAEDAAMRRDYPRLGPAEMGRRLGRSYSAVTSHASLMGLTHGSRRKHGRITTGTMREMVRLYGRGLTCAEVGSALGLHPTTIRARLGKLGLLLGRSASVARYRKEREGREATAAGHVALAHADARRRNVLRCLTEAERRLVAPDVLRESGL
jgi:hypothetical protein